MAGRTIFNAPWRDHLRATVRALAAEDATLAPVVDSASVLLHGSTTRGIDDEFSDLDVWLLPPTEVPWRFIVFDADGKPGQLQPQSRHEFEARVRRCDFPLIYELRHAVVLQDSDGWARSIISLARRDMPADVRAAWFTYHYIEMRSEHRACDNPIDRGDAAALLLAITPALAHAMQAAMIIDREPYPYSKWLAPSAAMTPTGAQIVPLVNRVIDLIGAGALRQGGPERDHPLNVALREIRSRLINAAGANGIDEPWLTDWYLHLDLRDGISRVAWEVAS